MPNVGVAYRMRIEMEVEMDGEFLIGMALGVVGVFLGMVFGLMITGGIRDRERVKRLRRMMGGKNR